MWVHPWGGCGVPGGDSSRQQKRDPKVGHVWPARKQRDTQLSPEVGKTFSLQRCCREEGKLLSGWLGTGQELKLQQERLRLDVRKHFWKLNANGKSALPGDAQ